MIPSWSVPRSDLVLSEDHPLRHLAAQLAPLERDPFGSVAPGSATATVAPGPKFHAPQTICAGCFSPTSTVQSCSRSAFGCFSAVRTTPTRKSAGSPGTPRRSSRSPRRSATDSRSAISSAVSVDAHVLPQPAHRDLHQNCLRKRRSFSQNGLMIGELVAQLGSALEAEPEGEAAPLVRVEADVGEHLRVDHAGAADLDPAGPLARGAAFPAARRRTRRRAPSRAR